ncbi:MAG: glycosyltransferase family 4 protein [Cyclobacteriaceae bacterium]
MKIAISINRSWNIYNFRSGLVKALIAEGHEVVAIAPKDEYSRLLMEMGCRFFPLEVQNTGSNPVKDISLYLEYIKIYKKVTPDIVLQYTIKPNIYGTLAAKRLSIPVINNVSGLGTVFLNNGMVSRIAQILYKIAFSRTDLVFFQNADDRKEFIYKINLPKLRTDLLPGSGINLARFTPKPKLNGEKFTFLMISRIIKDKGIYEYVNTAQKAKEQNIDAKFQLLGEPDVNHRRGIKKEEVDSWIDDGIIEYLGVTDHVDDVIKEVDCVVLPSYREGTPRTLLEGAAMAKPLIATDVAGCRQVVQEGENGLLCDVKDEESLLNAVTKVYQMDKVDLEQMGANGRAFMESNYDEKIVIDKYLYWINKLVPGD